MLGENGILCHISRLTSRGRVHEGVDSRLRDDFVGRGSGVVGRGCKCTDEGDAGVERGVERSRERGDVGEVGVRRSGSDG